ncbi:Peptide chain release factor 1 [Candidatus Vidania fulgoroideae]|uniref:Peptide chain release factor 1 n=1 Tax=Candidatus Vidania fulgoroideorum TaxID=881286 RepID=A0A346E0E5_9PROT|nr:Peptide chain release factor 1 [Candidatus Vidania fulgoroideae]
MKIYIEINKGIGGIESSIFVKNILTMYLSYFKRNKNNYEIISKINEENGIKNVTILVNIDWKKLKNEKGVHRIQRIPKTENSGRIHTSTCNVEVFKKITTNKIDIKKEDITISSFKASGAGGQHVNKTNSAVRIKHIPTGITVSCQNQRSQLQNKNEAIKILKCKINNKINNTLQNKKKMNRKKKCKVKRTDKIRTYNFKKKIIINHIKKKKTNLIDKVMNKGRLDLIT